MDAAALAVIIAGFALMLIAICVGYMQLKQIHAAVNSNMTTALNKIDELHGRLAMMDDALQHEKTRSAGRKPIRRKR